MLSAAAYGGRRPHLCFFPPLVLGLKTADEKLLACQQKLLEKQIVINSHPGDFEQLVA